MASRREAPDGVGEVVRYSIGYPCACRIAAARRKARRSLYFTDPDGLRIQLQDVAYCGGGGYLGGVCP